MQSNIRLVKIGDVYWTTANLTGAVQGQTTNFTLCAKPEDPGMFWKWGSAFMYNRVSGNSPYGHWGDVATGSGSYPAGDPCKSLGAYSTPTTAYYQALCAANNNNSVWVTLNGVGGRLFGIHNTAANATISAVPENCLFFPAAGDRYYTYGQLVDLNAGLYWSTTVHGATSSYMLSAESSRLLPASGGSWGIAVAVRCVAQ